MSVSSDQQKRRPWSVLWHPRSWGWAVWIVLALTIAGAMLRFYKVEETVMFQGDQGRDALIVSRIFTQRDPVFIGPVTSVGNMYLGPLYYYFMLPFLWLSYPSPMGPVYAVMILGILTIPSVWWVGRTLFNERTGIVAAILVTFSQALVELSRFSWNPNPLPFVGLWWFYLLFQAARGKRWYWLGVAVTVAIMLQLHYITFLAAGVSGVVWLWRIYIDMKRKQLRLLIWPSIISALIIAAFQIPLLLFDLRHNWLNSSQFVKIFQGEDAFATRLSPQQRLLQISGQSRSRLALLFIDKPFARIFSTGVVLAYSVLAFGVISWGTEQHRAQKRATGLLLLTVVCAVIGISVYKNDVYLHYLSWVLPLVLLLYSYLLDRLWRAFRGGSIAVLVLLVMYIFSNLVRFSYQGGGASLPSLSQTAAAVHKLVDPGEPYTMMLISESKDLYGMNYRYYLSTNPDKVPLDPERFADARKLFVIWEDKKVEKPLELPLYELLVFNVATPSAVVDVPNGPTILELRKE